MGEKRQAASSGVNIETDFLESFLLEVEDLAQIPAVVEEYYPFDIHIAEYLKIFDWMEECIEQIPTITYRHRIVRGGRLTYYTFYELIDNGQEESIVHQFVFGEDGYLSSVKNLCVCNGHNIYVLRGFDDENHFSCSAHIFDLTD